MSENDYEPPLKDEKCDVYIGVSYYGKTDENKNCTRRLGERFMIDGLSLEEKDHIITALKDSIQKSGITFTPNPHTYFDTMSAMNDILEADGVSPEASNEEKNHYISENAKHILSEIVRKMNDKNYCR
jgi:hypothetical protein